MDICKYLAGKISVITFIFFFIFLKETWHNLAKYPQLFWKKEDNFIIIGNVYGWTISYYVWPTKSDRDVI